MSNNQKTRAVGRRNGENVRELTITVPMPPRELSPNGYTRRRAHIAAKVAAREDAQTKARQAIILWQRAHKTSWQPIEGAVLVSALFIVGTGRRRDRDNAIASLKSTLDGFTRAGIWRDDSQVEWGTVNWFKQASWLPEVVITIKDTEGGYS